MSVYESTQPPFRCYFRRATVCFRALSRKRKGRVTTAGPLVGSYFLEDAAAPPELPDAADPPPLPEVLLEAAPPLVPPLPPPELELDDAALPPPPPPPGAMTVSRLS